MINRLPLVVVPVLNKTFCAFGVAGVKTGSYGVELRFAHVPVLHSRRETYRGWMKIFFQTGDILHALARGMGRRSLP